MALPGIVTGRNLVIASVQSSLTDSSVFILSNVAPEYRDNGGDLIQGDTWYSEESKVYSVYVKEAWVPVGGPGVYDRLDELEDHNHDVDGGNANREEYDDDNPVSPMVVIPPSSPTTAVSTALGQNIVVETGTQL